MQITIVLFLPGKVFLICSAIEAIIIVLILWNFNIRTKNSFTEEFNID